MIILLFLFLISTHLYPYFLSPVPLGYDPGLYLYLWRHDLSISWLKTSFPPIIFYLGKLLSFFTTPEHLLIPLSFLVLISLFVSLFLPSSISFGGTTTLKISSPPALYSSFSILTKKSQNGAICFQF